MRLQQGNKMEFLGQIYHENHAYFTSGFAAISFLLGCFTYFNKQSHERSLILLRQKLSSESAKQKQFYSLKSEQYQNYVNELDLLNNKYQVDIQKKLMPMLLGIFEGNTSNNLQSFMQELMLLIQESTVDYARLKHTSSGFRLTASDEMIVLLDELEFIHKTQMDSTLKFLTDFQNMDEQQLAKEQKALSLLGVTSEEKKKELIELMRIDLR